MSRRGENIRKRKDGRWEGRYLKYNTSLQKKIYISVYAPTYTEVRKKLLYAKTCNQNACEENYARSYTVGQIYVEWIAEVKQNCKYSTFVKYSSVYCKYMQIPLEGILIEELSNEIIKQKVIQSLINCEQQRESLCKSIYCVINQMVSYSAEKYGTANSHFSLKRGKIIHKPIEVLNKTEQRILLKFLYNKTDLSKLGIIICLSTGLRLGEICSLKWKDIDMNEKVLHVNRTVQRIATDTAGKKTVLLETTPKSLYSKREIPMSDEIVDLLKYFYRSDGYILCSDKPMEPRTYQNHFHKYLKDAGIEDKKFHILRHTFATNCIDNGADIKSLSEILGHADVKTTLNRYVHPTLETKRQHLNSLSNMYGQYKGQT